MNDRQKNNTKSEKLFDAIKNNKLEELSLLLEAKADQSIKNKDGNTPIRFAALSNKWSCVTKLAEFLDDKPSDLLSDYGSALLLAVWNDQDPLAKLLISKGAELEERHFEVDGYNVLHTAIEKENIPIIKLLLENKANPSRTTKITTKNQEEVKPLELAIKKNQHKTVELLLKAGADQSIKNKDGYTPIRVAANQHQWDCVTKLAEDIEEETNPLAKDYGNALLDAIEKINTM